jgi:hypothetical protein
LKSREDAADFARAYTDNPPDGAIEEYLDEALVETGEKEYPYYLPISVNLQFLRLKARRMRSFREDVQRAVAYHGHLCSGSASG